MKKFVIVPVFSLVLLSSATLAEEAITPSPSENPESVQEELMLTTNIDMESNDLNAMEQAVVLESMINDEQIDTNQDDTPRIQNRRENPQAFERGQGRDTYSQNIKNGNNDKENYQRGDKKSLLSYHLFALAGVGIGIILGSLGTVFWYKRKNKK